MKQPRIAHIIPDLNGFGGTEATLLRYLRASGIPLECQRVFVIRGTGTGDTLGTQMVRAGVSVHAMNQAPGLRSISALLRLWREVRAFRPDVISGWLYVPALLASVIAWSCPSRPAVMWHIRSLPWGRPFKKPVRYFSQRVLALLSHLTRPSLVSNSDAAVKAHAHIGFKDNGANWTVIGNGIDIGAYFPDPDAAMAVRVELGIPPDALVIGCVGRVVPEKGYPDLFEALSLLLGRRPDLANKICVVIAGNEATPENLSFYEMACKAVAPERLRLLGRRADVPRLLRSFDAYVLPSRSESFPNALVEAMASGIVCVATDVGQCRDVLDMPEFVVRSGHLEELASALERLLALDANALSRIGERNRQRVADKFALDVMVSRFDALFHSVAAGRALN